ncbi:MAG: hypothetical protein ACRDPS_08280 [Nocardioides sp.]|uniref:hypothetical protein n=1 Tax=Nocardioides sp. TaxID=35761 RepID=UPI003D6B9261
MGFDALGLADADEGYEAYPGRLHDLLPLSGSCSGGPAGRGLTENGERISVGDRIATRLNDRDVDVSNRDTWTVTAVAADGRIVARGRRGEWTLPADYVSEHVELAYATTAYGAQGETVRVAHVVIGDSTRAAAAYVGMTRGREYNVAHLVAEDVDDARRQWIEVFSRDRAGLGPARAAQRAAEDLERYGSAGPRRRVDHRPSRRQALRRPRPYAPGLDRSVPSQPSRGPGIGF